MSERGISYFHAIRIEGFKILVVNYHTIENDVKMAKMTSYDVIMTSNLKITKNSDFSNPKNVKKMY